MSGAMYWLMGLAGVGNPVLFLVAPILSALFVFVWTHRAKVDEKVEELADRYFHVDTDAPPPEAVVERRRAAWRAWTSGLVRIGCGCMIAAFSVQLLTYSMAFYSGRDAEVGKKLGPNVFRLTVMVVFLHYASNPKLLVFIHRVYVASPLGHHLFGIWPKTGDRMFRVFLGGALIANTGMACVTTPSFSEMLVFRLGPPVLAIMCSYETTPALQELTYFQIAVMGLCTCLCLVVNSCAHAWRRRYIFGPVIDDDAVDDVHDAWQQQLGTVLSAVITVAAFLVLPSNSAVQSVTEFIRNTVTDSQKRYVTAAGIALVCAWRGHVDHKRNTEPATPAVESRRQLAMANVRTFVKLSNGCHMLYFAWKYVTAATANAVGDDGCLGEPPGMAGLRYFYGLLPFIRLAHVVFLLYTRSYPLLTSFYWASSMVWSFVILIVQPQKNLRVAVGVCLGWHIVQLHLQEDRLSYFLYSLCTVTAHVWAVEFDPEGCFYIAIIFVCSGVLFTERDKGQREKAALRAAHARETSALEAKVRYDTARFEMEKDAFERQNAMLRDKMTLVAMTAAAEADRNVAEAQARTERDVSSYLFHEHVRNALLCTAMDWIFIPRIGFAVSMTGFATSCR